MQPRASWNIHRVVMVNPPVSLVSSVGRLDRLFAATIGPGEDGVELLYRRLYAQIANLYRASDRLELDENFLLGAAAATLKTDADFSAAIALTFRLQLVDMFFIGDLYAKTGVVTDPQHPPKVGDSLEDVQLSNGICVQNPLPITSRGYSRLTISSAGRTRPAPR